MSIHPFRCRKEIIVNGTDIVRCVRHKFHLGDCRFDHWSGTICFRVPQSGCIANLVRGEGLSFKP